MAPAVFSGESSVGNDQDAANLLKYQVRNQRYHQAKKSQDSQIDSQHKLRSLSKGSAENENADVVLEGVFGRAVRKSTGKSNYRSLQKSQDKEAAEPTAIKLNEQRKKTREVAEESVRTDKLVVHDSSVIES